MGVINVLDKHIAELIAAGEVVERPSSVIKELVENSIDAGAKNITVEIKNGGTTFMRVTDDGCGIQKDDIKVAFLRHATSKIKNQDDLDSISTLGFRGEALASISAVSKLQLLTRNKNEDIGTNYQINGGEEISFEDAGCPVGTTFIIKDLFYNIPARAKFLKKDISEGNAVSNVIDKTALSHPEISFTYIKDNKQVLKTFGDGKLISTIYAVLGKDMATGLIPVEYQLDAIKVYGYISKPEFARANRNLQNFFINGRYVKTRTAAAALEEAFKGSIMVGKFPSCVLNIELPYEIIDVNVHPAKIEVRFINERPVFDAVYHSVKSALLKYDSRKEYSFGKSNSNSDSKKFNPFNNAPAIFKKAESVNPDFNQNIAKTTTKSANNANNNSVNNNSKSVTFSDLGAKTSNPFAEKGNIKNDFVSKNADIFSDENSEKKSEQSSVMFDEPEFNPFSDISLNSPNTSKSIDIDNVSMAEPGNPFDIFSKKAIKNSAKEEKFKNQRKDDFLKIDQIPLNSSQSFENQSQKTENNDLKVENLGISELKINDDISLNKKSFAQKNEISTDSEQNNSQFADLILENEDVNIKYIGEIFSTYIIAEKNNKEILLIDKHAAHERMIYEKLKSSKAAEFSQLLLQPVTVTLNKEEYDAVINNLSLFKDCCFEVEDFGNGTVLVRCAPQYIDAVEVSDCIVEMADYILKGKNDILTEKMDWFYHNVACRTAIKAGNKSSTEELIEIVKKVEKDPQLKYCPHGRPICVVMTKYEIEKQFGRV